MPGYSTVRGWERDDPEFLARSTRAREDGCHAMAQDCLQIADDARNDWMDARAAEGDEKAAQFNGEHVQRSKLRIETRMRLLGKWLPKVYGDKVTSEHTGLDGGAIHHAVTISPEESYKRMLDGE